MIFVIFGQKSRENAKRLSEILKKNPCKSGVPMV